MDRGDESVEMQNFVLEHMEKDDIILIRGNHEDLFCEFATTDEGIAYSHHQSNGTLKTALALTGYERTMSQIRHFDFAEACRETPFYKNIIPSMVDYYEAKKYIFVHGWIPCFQDSRYRYDYFANWRDSGQANWAAARWFNGIDAAKCGVYPDGKTVVCGHWHTSYGHSKYERACTEFGDDADFSPYYAPGIIALDACTAHTNKVNVIVLEDDELA